jgi:hypothetical protein
MSDKEALIDCLIRQGWDAVTAQIMVHGLIDSADNYDLGDVYDN